MNIYLSHPVHGFKIATMDTEAEADEQNGWERYNPATPSAPKAVSEVAAPENVLGVKRRRKEPSLGA